jgi:glycosyltransferase involved in cell wall biosynthesis
VLISRPCNTNRHRIATTLNLSRILLVHNSYREPGGEDQVFESESRLLRANGHQVTEYRASNDDLNGTPIQLVVNTVWNSSQYHQLVAAIRETSPDIVHVHNFFPVVSPAVYYAARAHGVPVVQTLHNYRLVCPGATLFREGKVCEDCVGARMAWRGVAHGCYRGSIAATAAVTAMVSAHRAASTWKSVVSQYIVLNDFSKELFARAGFPREKLFTKPNFVDPDPGFSPESGKRALFVGRLTPEKGLATVLEVWRDIGARLPLDIVGDGPLSNMAKQAAAEIPGVRWLKWLPREDVFSALRDAYFVVVPSEWYEPFGMIVAEAFAVGVPVIASKIGGLSSMIDHEKTGLHCEPGNARDLLGKIRWAIEHPREMAEMRLRVRQAFEDKYTAATNYRHLMDVYAIARRCTYPEKLMRGGLVERVPSSTGKQSYN